MARKARFNLPGIPQHLIQRGNNREPCFFAESDYQRYLADLSEAADRNACRIHAYALMTNHVHVLVTPMSEHGLSHLMQDLGRKYVRYINQRYRRSGTLWEGRYKSSLIDSEAYLLTCMRYIELNPVRAHMVEHPGDYRFSSYACNAYGRNDRLVTPHPIYAALSADPTGRQEAYRELFGAQMESDLLHAVREALNQELVLGREDFKQKIEHMSARQARPGQPGRPRTRGVEEAQGDYYVL
jgi:putative transposase